MEIIKADKNHKEQVLKLLDDFRTVCKITIDPKKNKNFKSDLAKKYGGKIFDKVIKSSDGLILLAKNKNKYIGIVTIYKIPQIRVGRYCGEIEEMYVDPNFQGKGVAQKLMEAAEKWAKGNKIDLRLESSKELKRAHAFYKKSEFKFYGKAFYKKFD